MGQAKVDHTGEYKLVADNGHGKDEVSICHQKQLVSAAWTRMTNSPFYLFPFIYNLSICHSSSASFQVNFIIDVEVPPDPPGQPEVIMS